MSDAPSTLVIGEARDFSTGTFRSVSTDAMRPGSGRAELIIERRVWTGRYWADAGSRDAMEAYRVFRNRQDRDMHAADLAKLSNPPGIGPAVTITELDTGKSFRSTGPWV